MSGRRLVANLLFESELARAFPPPGLPAPEAAHPQRPRPRSTPSRAALETAAGYGTLMRAFARDGDRLWLPAPIDPARMLEVPGLPRPILESGPLSALSPCGATLAWGESPAIAALRWRGCRGGPPWPPSSSIPGTGRPQGGAPMGLIPGPVHDPGAGTIPADQPRILRDSEAEPIAEVLWSLTPSSPDTVARVHHRSFALDLARALGCALPGAAMLDSIHALDAHLRAGAAPAGRWVVKAPLSASGRDRYVERGIAGRSPLDEPALRRRLEGLFATHGQLLFEPWMERRADFGACALLTPEGLLLLGFHRLRVDLRGQFAGIEADLDAPGAGLAPEEEALFTSTVEFAGAALAREGYSGPFGLDAWRYRDSQGALRFHPLGEINARLTFGFVARALAERLGASGMFGSARRFRLEVGETSTGALPLLAGPTPGTVLASLSRGATRTDSA